MQTNNRRGSSGNSRNYDRNRKYNQRGPMNQSQPSGRPPSGRPTHQGHQSNRTTHQGHQPSRNTHQGHQSNRQEQYHQRRPYNNPRRNQPTRQQQPAHRSQPQREKRTAEIVRNTNETQIQIRLDVDGTGRHTIKTGIPFLDHMLVLFARHGVFNLDVNAKGDIEVDIHHTNEDVALSLGEAFTRALGEKKGIRRYGFFYVPMGEALVRSVLDISNRPSVTLSGFPRSAKTNKEYNYHDCEHFLKSFSQTAGLNLHIAVLEGGDRHHVIEAIFKSLSRSLDMATSIDDRNMSVPSTKGTL